MNRLQRHLRQAGEDLQVRVVIPFSLRLASGAQLTADAWLPQLGAPNGTIVTQRDEALQSNSVELRSLGYTWSSYSEPSDSEKYEAASYREMFKDWGWAALNDQAPNWIKDKD